jgi:hypothetical protein
MGSLESCNKTELDILEDGAGRCTVSGGKEVGRK